MDLFKSLSHPDEVYALLKFKIGGCEATIPKLDYVSSSKDFSIIFSSLDYGMYIIQNIIMILTCIVSLFHNITHIGQHDSR